MKPALVVLLVTVITFLTGCVAVPYDDGGYSVAPSPYIMVVPHGHWHDDDDDD